MLDSGDSSLIISPHGKIVLIDGGEKNKNILIPYLLARKIKKIDYIFVSHFDSDHVGGILEIMQAIKVKTVLISSQQKTDNFMEFIKIAKDKKIKIIEVKARDRIRIEKDLFFDIIWPDNSKKINENLTNNNSIVCKLNYNNFSMLFTGDIEKQAEEEILSEYKYNIDILKSTVLKIAHHGSKTSSSNRFLKAVKPKITLICVGKNNNFGHPNSEVIGRLEKYGCAIYRTDYDGEIFMMINVQSRIKIRKKIIITTR